MEKGKEGCGGRANGFVRASVKQAAVKLWIYQCTGLVRNDEGALEIKRDRPDKGRREWATVFGLSVEHETPIRRSGKVILTKLSQGVH